MSGPTPARTGTGLAASAPILDVGLHRRRFKSDRALAMLRDMYSLPAWSEKHGGM